MDDLNTKNNSHDLVSGNEKSESFAQRNVDGPIDRSEQKSNLNTPKATEVIDKILNVTLTIKSKFPELSKFLDEIPETEFDYLDQNISLQDLSDYYESLKAILEKYNLEHPIK